MIFAGSSESAPYLALRSKRSIEFAGRSITSTKLVRRSYQSKTFQVHLKNAVLTTIVCIKSKTDLDDAVRVFRRANMHHEFQRYISAIFRFGEVRDPGAGNLFDHARSAVFPSMP